VERAPVMDDFFPVFPFRWHGHLGEITKNRGRTWALA
jgi:hypothetical protein